MQDRLDCEHDELDYNPEPVIRDGKSIGLCFVCDKCGARAYPEDTEKAIEEWVENG